MLGPDQARVEERIKENLLPLLSVHFSDSQMSIESEAC